MNIVSAPAAAKERGIIIDEVTRAAEGDYESLITLTVETDDEERAISGTVFHYGKSRIISINGIKADAELSSIIIYASNEDRPGFVGRFAGIPGAAGLSAHDFRLWNEAVDWAQVKSWKIFGTHRSTIAQNSGDCDSFHSTAIGSIE